jgi:hypothetical protein
MGTQRDEHRVTVDTYGHLVIDDLKQAINALPKLESGTVVDAEYVEVEPDETFPSNGPPVVQDAISGEKKGRSRRENLFSSGHFYESGRQDLNLRPLGPERRLEA